MNEIDLSEQAQPIEVPPSPELAAATADLARTADAKEGVGSCLTIGVIYGLFYLSGVLLCWMLGSAAHRYTRGYDQLAQAKDLTEVRDALVSAFGPVQLTPIDVTNRVTPLSETINAVKDSADAVRDAATSIDAAVSSVQNTQAK